MGKNNYWVSPDERGWKVQREGTSRAAGITPTQAAAESLARGILQNGQGGELITQGTNGQIRSKDTINSNDPYPPKDREH